MPHPRQSATCRYLDELILLLDEERETRGHALRPELTFSMGVLREEASRGGASARTIGLIHAAEVVLALHEMPAGSGALQ